MVCYDGSAAASCLAAQSTFGRMCLIVLHMQNIQMYIMLLLRADLMVPLHVRQCATPQSLLNFGLIMYSSPLDAQ